MEDIQLVFVLALKEYVNRVTYSESAIVLAIIHKKANKYIEILAFNQLIWIDQTPR